MNSTSQPDMSIYSLHLTDDLSWDIYATKDASSWLDELARIIQMKRIVKGGYPGIYCVSGPDDIKNLSGTRTDYSDSITKRGWIHRKLWSLDTWQDQDIRQIICDIGTGDDRECPDTIKMLMFMYMFYERIISSGGLPIHGGLVEKNGTGAILAGRGNVGKSTCCRRISDSWHALCDDETMVISENNMNYNGHPFPTWSEYYWGSSRKTWDVKKHVPIKGIFFIAQAEEDGVEPIEKGQSALYIYGSAMQKCQNYLKIIEKDLSSEIKRNIFNNACDMSKKIPSYMLKVSLNGRFWEKMEEAVPIG